eukprot:1648681-Pyramimonas_sp.AAC.1
MFGTAQADGMIGAASLQPCVLCSANSIVGDEIPTTCPVCMCTWHRSCSTRASMNAHAVPADFPDLPRANRRDLPDCFFA